MNALMLIGLPADLSKDKKVATKVASFSGIKIACGGSTSQMLAREWAKPLNVLWANALEGLPPTATIQGLDLATEGIITLREVLDILANKRPLKTDPASKLVAMLLSSQYVEFHIGTAINPAKKGRTLPSKMSIARKIASLLQQRGKETRMIYW